MASRNLESKVALVGTDLSGVFQDISLASEVIKAVHALGTALSGKSMMS